jgi:hypothetical protein
MIVEKNKRKPRDLADGWFRIAPRQQGAVTKSVFAMLSGLSLQISTCPVRFRRSNEPATL